MVTIKFFLSFSDVGIGCNVVRYLRYANCITRYQVGIFRVTLVLQLTTYSPLQLMVEAYTCMSGRAVAYQTTHNELSAVDWHLKTSQSH